MTKSRSSLGAWRFARGLIGIVFLLGLATGCRSLLPQKDEEEKETTRPAPIKIPIGTVHLVDEEERFVLVRTTRFLDVEPDRELMVMNTEGREIARLRVSPARKGSFLTADILAGDPRVGNHVLMNHSVAEDRGAGASGDDEVQVLE